METLESSQVLEVCLSHLDSSELGRKAGLPCLHCSFHTLSPPSSSKPPAPFPRMLLNRAPTALPVPVTRLLLASNFFRVAPHSPFTEDFGSCLSIPGNLYPVFIPGNQVDDPSHPILNTWPGSLIRPERWLFPTLFSSASRWMTHLSVPQ